MSGHRRKVRHMALPAADPFGVGRADLGARARAGMARQALAAKLQGVRNGGRRPRSGAAATPRALREASEPRIDEPRLRRDRRVALAAAAHRPRRGGGAVR